MTTGTLGLFRPLGSALPVEQVDLDLESSSQQALHLKRTPCPEGRPEMV